jgi:hypothetical protein
LHFVIYKTTNLINGKFYIGMHKTRNKNDGYMGSGKLLKRAFEKYGRENFSTVILLECQTEEEMKLAEKILVVFDLEVSYNLCEGGQGGFSYINRSGLAVRNIQNLTKTPSEKNRRQSSERLKLLHSQGKVVVPNTKGIRYKLSEETKMKMREAAKLREAKKQMQRSSNG